MGAKMVYRGTLFGEIEYRFEKYPNGATVNIYNEDDYEVDMFTNYDIGSDFDAFEERCKEWLEELATELA